MFVVCFVFFAPLFNWAAPDLMQGLWATVGEGGHGGRTEPDLEVAFRDRQRFTTNMIVIVTLVFRHLKCFIKASQD